MSLDLLQKDIETKSFRRIYYLYGPEPYLKRFYLNSLISALLPDNRDMDLHRYEGKGLSVDLFSEELWLCPMGQYKVLLISDLPNTAPVTEFLGDESCEIGEDTVVIVYQQTESPDKRTNGFKQLSARLKKDGLLVEIKTVDDETLTRWVAQQFRRRGCTIDPENVAYFLSVEERNMESMLTEIDKISAYCSGPVDRDALEKLCVKTVQARVYELNNYILTHDTDKLYRVLNDLYALRTAPQVILGSLFSCFGGLYKLKLLEGQPESVLSAETEFAPFLIRRYSGYLKKIPLERLDRLLDSCAQIDVQTKSTGVDAELMVSRLIQEALSLL